MMNLRCAIHRFVFFLVTSDVGARVVTKVKHCEVKSLTLIRFRKSSLCDSCFFLACQEIHDAMTCHDTMNWSHFSATKLRNPKGLVPTLCEDGMPPVYESAVCVEYIDELAQRSGGNLDRTLMPGSPAERAALRLKVDWINKSLWWSSTVFRCTSPFFGLQMPKVSWSFVVLWNVLLFSGSFSITL